jgi:hypothetical protein
MKIQMEHSGILVNDRPAEIGEDGKWRVAGILASRKLSNYLDGLYKDMVEMAFGAIDVYSIKL